MNFKTQGFIKEINLTTGTFTVDPVPPYAFEKHESNGTSKKLALYVRCDVEDANAKAMVVKEKLELILPESIKGRIDLLIVMRHEHDKLEIEIDEKEMEKVLQKDATSGDTNGAESKAVARAAKKLMEEVQASVSVAGLKIVK